MENYVFIVSSIVLFAAWLVTYRRLRQARGYRRMEKRRLDFTLAFLNKTMDKKIINAVDLNFLTDNKILPHIIGHCDKLINNGEVKEIGKKLDFIYSLEDDKKDFLLHQMRCIAGVMSSHDLAGMFMRAKFFWHIDHSRTAELVVNFVLFLAEENKTNRASFIAACTDELNNNILPEGEKITPDVKVLLQADIINTKKQLRVTD